jgi:hypothetical protein
VLKVAILLLVIVDVAAAQTTWKGLRFGMTATDVRKSYPAPLVQKRAENGDLSLLDQNQKLAGIRSTAEFYFGKSGKLEQIGLSMKDPFASKSDTDAAGSSLAVIETVNDQLVEKYGAAVSQKGHCGLTADDFVSARIPIFTCERLWKSSGQTIKMFWVVKDDRISSLALVYEPLSGDI